MKHLYLTILLSLASTLLFAGPGFTENSPYLETTDSIPSLMFTPGYQWSLDGSIDFSPNLNTSSRYRISDSTELINGNEYFILLKSSEEIGEDNFVDSGIRLIERAKKIYYLNPNRDDDDSTDDADYLMYDYNAEVGDTITYRAIIPNSLNPDQREYKVIVTEIDSVTLLNGERRKHWRTRCASSSAGYELRIIEGMGDRGGFFAPIEFPCNFINLGISSLICYSFNGEVLHGRLSSSDTILPPENCLLDNTISTRHNERAVEQVLRVYPNPTSSTFTVEGLTVANALLHDVNGWLVARFGSGNEINIAHLDHGVYVLTAFNGAGKMGIARVMVGR